MEIILKYFADFTDVQLKRFSDLEKLYREWNSKINIISRKDIDSLYDKHVLHSLSIAAAFDFVDGTEIIDIGTGGGFPGIPLAIFFPEVKFHLVDSIAKKLKVVDAIAKALDLGNVSTQHIRAEEIKTRKFDFAVSRAVAPLKELWRWSRPLLSHKGQGTRHKKQAASYEQPTTNIQQPRPTGSSGREITSNEQQVTSNQPPGLICLKGGDLATEISDSGTRPRVIEIHDIFPEEFFKEKYILYVNG